MSAAVPPHAARYLDRSTLDDYYTNEAEQVLQPVREFARQKGWQLEAVRMSGYPPDALAAHANAGVYDLIVMGTHGHSALGNAILAATGKRMRELPFPSRI